MPGNALSLLVCLPTPIFTPFFVYITLPIISYVEQIGTTIPYVEQKKLGLPNQLSRLLGQTIDSEMVLVSGHIGHGVYYSARLRCNTIDFQLSHGHPDGKNRIHC
jgi:hypothetical protein